MVRLDEITDKLANEQVFHDKTELGEVFERLDDDTPDQTNMSNIDFNSRLSTMEINSCMIIDELNRLGILPGITLTRQKKRLSVSLEGRGRTEKVEMVAGAREQRSGIGFGERFASLFKRRE